VAAEGSSLGKVTVFMGHTRDFPKTNAQTVPD